MKSLSAVVRRIKELKIQGAEEVAIAAVNAWKDAKDKKLAAKVLEQARPTEPMLRNAMKYLRIYGNPDRFLDMVEKGRQRISLYGSRLIKNDSIVYTHCHSSTVESILKRSKDSGMDFEVHVTETRPLFQGRITAAHLSKYHIKVKMFVDSAAMYAMKDADVMLIGSDAITSDGEVVNKIGSRLFAKIASEMGIPVYAAADSLKFDPMTKYGFTERIERRSEREVWPNKPHGVDIVNPAFEVVPSEYVEGVITEFGILKPDALVTELERNYAWMFEK
ncbi:MAG: translation initiation factor eIF-2B [Candidatus Micrarchaeia archaeon]